jgi:flagellar hook-associated protein 1 FlgK
MAGLFHTLNVGSEALHTTRQGVDTAGHNIANAQVEGYSRQRVNIKQRDPLQERGVLLGNGVYVGSISRSHDQFIENQLNKSHQAQGRARMRADGLREIEGIFSPELQAGVADELTNFFSALQDLANSPEDHVVRTAVVETAKNLVGAFRRVDGDLRMARAGLNERVQNLTSEVNDKLKAIAELNVRIQVTEAGEGMQANDLRDQRDTLLRDVSGKLDIKYYEDKFGMVLIRGPNQVTLVDGGHNSTVGVVRNNDNGGLFDVTVTDWEEHTVRNVTGKLEEGELAALVELRDKDVPGLVKHNDAMALEFTDRFNEVHRDGYGIKDYAEQAGRDFFTVADRSRGAGTLDVDAMMIHAPDAISAGSTPLAPGDNINLNRLVRLKDDKHFGDLKVSFNEYYANYAGALGLDVQRAGHIQEANDVMLADLQNRREAVSGVSLDEEATEMMKWQANFTASSKVITTVDEMLETVLGLKR